MMTNLYKAFLPLRLSLFLVGVALLAGCASEGNQGAGKGPVLYGAGVVERPQDLGLVQVATIDSLLAGVYDGVMSFGELKQKGNFGIGTVDRLDGEMLMLWGDVYQVRSDGRVYLPPDDVTTPFASVLFFRPTLRMGVKGPLNYLTLSEFMDDLVPQKNIPVAVHIRGKFASMKTRSVPAQEPPYPPLVEVTRNQPEFELGKVEGDVVGFRLPDYLKGINVPGYHLHFLSADRTAGGHILAMELEEGEIQVELVHDFHLILPVDSVGFAEVDLSLDRSEELRQVESER